jgi:hypothetical protein
MKTQPTLDGRSPEQLSKEREQRKRNYWHTRYCEVNEMNKMAISFIVAENKRMSKIETAARELEEFLGKNSGDTADWPIDVIARDKDSAIKLQQLLQKLSDTLRK